MPKASLTLENGTVVTIEGTASEVHELLSFYGSAASRPAHGQVHKSPAAPVHRDPRSAADDAADAEVDLMTIVNHVKACDEAENIESRILDQTDQLPRVLLPMYMVYEHMSNAHGLTSGQISRLQRSSACRSSSPMSPRYSRARQQNTSSATRSGRTDRLFAISFRAAGTPT